MRMLTGSTWVNGSAMLEHGTTLISSGAPMVQIPAFGVIVLLTLPTPLSLPSLGVNLSMELLVCVASCLCSDLSKSS